MSETYSSPAPTRPAGEPQPQTDINLPDPNALPELVLYSRSTVFYWWPIWVIGYIMALITLVGGERFTLSNGREILVHPNTGVGITFIVILTLIMLFTNVKLRGIYSVVMILAAAFVTVLFAWLGWWDRIFSLIPQLTIHLNFGFYFAFATILLVIWLLRFFIFDKMVYWRIRPGQLTTERVIGGGEQSYDTRGMLFEQQGDDFFRHILLGLGSGDIRLLMTGARKEEIEIPNVLFAKNKIETMQRLIAIKPDEALAKTTRSV